MYIDSTNFHFPDGDQTVAKELRKYIEPLLYVSVAMYKEVLNSILDFSLPSAGVQSGCGLLGSPPFLPENLPHIPTAVYGGSHHTHCHRNGRERSLQKCIVSSKIPIKNFLKLFIIIAPFVHLGYSI